MSAQLVLRSGHAKDEPVIYLAVAVYDSVRQPEAILDDGVLVIRQRLVGARIVLRLASFTYSRLFEVTARESALSPEAPPSECGIRVDHTVWIDSALCHRRRRTSGRCAGLVRAGRYQ